MKPISRGEIKRKLAAHYGGDVKGSMERRILVECNCRGYNRPEYDSAIFFFLSGSPPKGYAIVVPGHRAIHLYDAWGRRFQILNDVELEGRAE